MDYEFTSVLDLKAHIKPALDSKVKELRRKKIDYVSQDDILNTNNEVFCNYVVSKIKNHQ